MAAMTTLIMDPRLLMAARLGDSKQLKKLLRLMNNKDDDDEEEASAAGGAASSSSSSRDVVIVEVSPPAARRRRPTTTTVAAAFGAPAPLDDHHGDGVMRRVTMTNGDTLLHVVAASGDSQEFLDCATMIVQQAAAAAADPMAALQARNSKGDTPLHCAAGAGNADMLGCLLDLLAAAADSSSSSKLESVLEMQNKCAETALHQAIRASTTSNNKNKVACCIDRLMAADPELACIPCDGAGASPLYLAVSLGELEIAEHLLGTSKGRVSYSGPDGRNVLHAAVAFSSRGGGQLQALQTILEWLDVKTTRTGDMQATTTTTQKKKERGSNVAAPAPAADDDDSLLSQLTTQKDRQQKGSTPLHLAASLGGWPSLAFIEFIPEFRAVFPPRYSAASRTSAAAAALLLDANVSTAYQADDEGSYPVHVAAWCDSLDTVKMLLQRCPDCATLRDGSERTFLHVAVGQESLDVVRHVCKTPELASILLNAQDMDGDTALHGAVRAGNVDAFNYLLMNPEVRLDVANKQGMTPRDLSWTSIPAGLNYALNPRSVVRLSLLLAGAPHGGGRPELFIIENKMPKGNVKDDSEKYTQTTQVTSIVAALIVTVTFTAAFTLPGGYRGAEASGGGGDNGKKIAAAAAAAGTPVLGGSYAFNAFVLADTLAFLASTLATCTLVYAGSPSVDLAIRNLYFSVAAGFLQSSARSFVVAFALGLYLVLAPNDHTTAVIVCIVVAAFSLYGCIGLRQGTLAAMRVLARTGGQSPAAWTYSRLLCTGILLMHFGSYIIIFGVPALQLIKVHESQMR